MPTRIIERGTAGPAYSAATCPVITKIPAPMTAPMPSVTRLRGPSARLRACSPAASASARRVAIGLVANRVIRQSGGRRGHSPRRRDDRDYRRGERGEGPARGGGGGGGRGVPGGGGGGGGGGARPAQKKGAPPGHGGCTCPP